MSGRGKLNKTGAVVGIGLVVAAVATELRKPAGERTGFGRVAGFVPYDFRPPTPGRIRASVWAPEDPRLLKPHAFGVGWTVNVGRVFVLLRRVLAR